MTSLIENDNTNSSKVGVNCLYIYNTLLCLKTGFVRAIGLPYKFHVEEGPLDIPIWHGQYFYSIQRQSRQHDTIILGFETGSYRSISFRHARTLFWKFDKISLHTFCMASGVRISSPWMMTECCRNSGGKFAHNQL